MRHQKIAWTAFAASVIALSSSVQADEQALVVAADDEQIEWGPCPGFFPDSCRIGVLHGDPGKPNADIFFRVPADTRLPEHTHTSAERMVLVSGEMEVEYRGQPPAMIQTGDYAYGPAGHPHSAAWPLSPNW